MATRQEYLDELRSPISTYIFRVELLDKNENVLDVITDDVIDGSVNINRQNGSRRSASITLQNSSFEYFVDPDSNIWLENRFRIWTGLLVNGEEVIKSQGIFVLGEPNISSNYAEKTVTLELYDKFSFLDGTLSGELTEPYIVPVDENVVDVVEAIFTLIGEVKPLIATASSESFPYTLRIESGQTYFDLLQKLSEAITYEIFYDRDGFPTFKPPSVLDDLPALISLTETDRIKMNSNKRQDVKRVRNKVVVEGQRLDTGELIRATAIDTTSDVGTTRILERTKYIKDDIINTNTLAQLRADFELSELTQVFETVNINIYPDDELDVGIIIEITDAGLDLDDGRYLINQLTVPLRKFGGTSMTADVWRAVTFN